jgi:hypothetical protein
MGYEAHKTEHAGPKRGSGAYWGRKVEAKHESNRKRRADNKAVVQKEMNDEQAVGGDSVKAADGLH